MNKVLKYYFLLIVFAFALSGVFSMEIILFMVFLKGGTLVVQEPNIILLLFEILVIALGIASFLYYSLRILDSFDEPFSKRFSGILLMNLFLKGSVEKRVEGR